jgi:hypothetical protein
LKLKLAELDLPPDNYSLDELIPNRYIFTHSGSKWQTFGYNEDRITVKKKEFETEDEACQDMLTRMIDLMEWRKKYHIK